MPRNPRSPWLAIALLLLCVAARAEDDFDAFWANRRAESAALPLKAEVTALRTEGDVSLFEIGYASTRGVHIHGFLGVPGGPGRHPGLVLIPGLGDRGRVELAREGARRGFLTVSCDLRGQGKATGSPPDRIAIYLFGQPEDHFVTGAVTDVLRAIDFVAARPEWDGRWMFVQGFSLGGGLTIAATALDSRVDAAAIGAPAFCDFQRSAREGRELQMTALRGWLNSLPDPEAAFRKLGMVDNNNFAARIHVPVVFGMNRRDPVIEFAGVKRAYELVPCADKTFLEGEAARHSPPGDFVDAAEALFRRAMGQVGM